VYAIHPRAWTPTEVQALRAFAIVFAELVRTAVELANRQVEAAQLRRALASRVWIEQAKGILAATQGVTLDEAFRQMRVRARASSRKRWPRSPKRSSRTSSGSGSRCAAAVMRAGIRP